VPGAIEAEQRAILAAAGDLWCQGRELDWLTLHGERPTLESIPTYPFARDRHWLDVPTAVVQVPMLSNVLTAQTSAAAAAPFLIPQNPTIIQSLPVGNSSMDQATLLLKELFELFAENSGEDLSETPPDQSFLELGFDSLFLTQAALSIKKRYKVEIPFRRLLSDVPDFGSLAALLITQVDAALLPNPGAAPASTPAAIAAVAQASLPAFAPAQMPQAPIQMLDAAALSGVQGLIQQQLQLMARQLEMLGAAPATYSQNAYAPAPTAASAQAVAAAAVAKTISPVAAADEKLPAKPFGAQARIDISGKDDFTPAQRQHYQQLVAEYTQHTAKSKAFTEKARLQLSDPRVVSGFRPAVKEITYPIVVNRSKGVRFWDIDGNEYIDTLCGYGSMFFGYQPDWIVAALTAQLQEGMEIGPQHPLTHEVIQLLNEFLPHERYAFCNTGSEAVLGAMRMARTNTGRDKIVMFNGDYHGIVDEVIVRGGRNHKSFPAAAGIMADAVKNMVILEYGSDEALDYIRDNADDIAGVLVETVQSRHPALVPIEFLKKLRELTRAKDVAMIFDEVITGFRVAPGGFQEYAGIQADICTYGKVIGGGVSLGIIAGFAKYMDTLDGGAWQFGDDSKPEVGVTYFAGTFVRHPLALAAAKAVLLHLKEQGPQLQRGVNERAAQFANDLNLHFKRVNAPMEIEQFCSMMYFKFTEDLPWGELLFCDMRRQGIHIWYGRPIFVSCAHTDEDMAQIRSAFMRSLARMQEWGFIPGSSRDTQGRELAPPVSGAQLGIDAQGNPAWFVEDASAPNGQRQVSASFE
jgi:glutamate-1-semialdehyde aminotransferase/acyl carrier protein